MDISILDRSLLTQMVTCFCAGGLSVLTPCVYPLIPVTVSVFTGTECKTRLDQCLQSIFFALGICLTYTILGLLAANAIIFFGSFLGGTWFVTIATIILLAMVLSNLHIVEVPLFSKLQQIGHSLEGRGRWGAFLFGAGSGMIAAPCVGPILTTILTIAASHNQPIIGSMLLFLYALGLSLPFLVLGSFSSLIIKLPKSGGWMYGIKFITAVGILLTILYFHRERADTLFEPLHLYRYPLALTGIILFGILFGRLGVRIERPWIKLFGACLCAFALYHVTIFSLPVIVDGNGLRWNASLEDELSAQKNTVILVDTEATWCASCKEMEEKTLRDAAVQSTMQKFSLVKIDFSDYGEDANRFAKKYDVQGIPTMLFLRRDGTEIPGTRLTGFIGASELISHLEMIQTSSAK